jgi:hypothetical protein
VDINKVAEVQGFKNPKSVANRIAQLKKKYGLPLSSASIKALANKDGDAATAEVPKTPSSNRVTKARASKKVTPRAAKGAKAKKEAKDEESDADADAHADADADADADAESGGDTFFIDGDRLDSGRYQVDGDGNPFSYKGLVAQDTEQEAQLKKFYQKALEKDAEDEANGEEIN